MTNLERVKEFHEAMSLDIDKPVNIYRLKFRENLITEEYDELNDELTAMFIRGRENFSQEATLKECADLLYVVYGTAITFGWDLDEAFKRVHESNMSKLGEDGKPIHDKNGKVVKGPNYQPPDLSDLVRQVY